MFSLSWKKNSKAINGDALFGFKKEILPEDLLNLDLNNISEEEFLQDQKKLIQEYTSLQTPEEMLRVEVNIRILGHLLSRNCESFIRLRRNQTPENSTDITLVKAKLVRLIRFIRDFVVAMTRRGFSICTNEFFRRPNILEVSTYSDDFEFMAHICEPLIILSRKLSEEGLTKNEKKILLNNNCYTGPRAQLFKSHLNLLKYHPNYEKLKENSDEFKDLSFTWGEDRFESEYFCENEQGRNIFGGNLTVESVSKIAGNQCTADFFEDFLEKNGLKTHLMGKKNVHSLFFYILVNKLKFKRGVIACGDSQEKLNEFLLNYFYFLMVVQEIDIGCVWHSKSVPKYQEISDSMAPKRKILMKALNLEKDIEKILILSQGIYCGLKESDFTVDELRSFLKHSKGESFQHFVIFLVYLKDLLFKTDDFKSSLYDLFLELWCKDEDKLTVLHVLLTCDSNTSWLFEFEEYHARCIGLNFCKALEIAIAQAFDHQSCQNTGKLQEIFRNLPIAHKVINKNGSRIFSDDELREIYNDKLLENFEQCIPNQLLVDMFVNLTCNVCPDNDPDQLGKMVSTLLNNLFQKNARFGEVIKVLLIYIEHHLHKIDGQKNKNEFLEFLKKNEQLMRCLKFYADFVSRMTVEKKLSSYQYCIFGNMQYLGDFIREAALKNFKEIRAVLDEQEKYNKQLLSNIPKTWQSRALIFDFLTLLEDRMKAITGSLEIRSYLSFEYNADKGFSMSRDKFIELLDSWYLSSTSFISNAVTKSKTFDKDINITTTPDINILEYFLMKLNQSLHNIVENQLIEKYIRNFDKNRLPAVGLFFNSLSPKKDLLFALITSGEYEPLSEEQINFVQSLRKLNFALIFVKFNLRNKTNFARKKELVELLEEFLNLFDKVYPNIIDLIFMETESLIIAEKRLSKMLETEKDSLIRKIIKNYLRNLNNNHSETKKSFSGYLLDKLNVFKTLSNTGRSIMKFGSSFDDEAGNFKRIANEFRLRKKKILTQKLSEGEFLNLTDPLISTIVAPAFLFDDLLREIIPENSTIVMRDNMLSTFFAETRFQDKLIKVFTDFQTFWNRTKHGKKKGKFLGRRYICTIFVQRFIERAISALGMDMVLAPVEAEEAALCRLINKNIESMIVGFKTHNEIIESDEWYNEKSCTCLTFENFKAVCCYFKELNEAGEEKKEIFKRSLFKLRKIFQSTIRYYVYCSTRVGDLNWHFTAYKDIVFEYLKNIEKNDMAHFLKMKNLYEAVIVRDFKMAISAYGFDFQLDTINDITVENDELVEYNEITLLQENMTTTKAIGFILQALLLIGRMKKEGNDLAIEISDLDAMKSLVSINNVGKFFTLFNQFFERLKPLIPADIKKDKFIADCFYSKIDCFNDSLKCIWEIEVLPPNFDEDILKYGISLSKFFVLNEYEEIVQFREEAFKNWKTDFFFDMNKRISMFAARGQTSNQFSELYLSYLEILGNIITIPTTNSSDVRELQNDIYDCLEYAIRTSSPELVGATLELTLKSSFYSRADRQVAKSIGLQFSAENDINDYFGTAPRMAVETVLKLCESCKSSDEPGELQLKLKPGQDITKLQLAQSQIQSMEFPKRVINFLIKNYYTKLNESIIWHDGILEKPYLQNIKAYIVSFDFYLKAISLLCCKYPLLIPLVEGYEVSIEHLEKDVPLPWFHEIIRRSYPAGEKQISFPEYVLLTINFHKTNSCQLFLSLAKRSYSFTKEKNGEIASSSVLQQTKYLALLRKYLLQSCEPGFFKSQLCVEGFKQHIYLYSRLLCLFEDYRDIEWEKNEMMKTLKTFNYITEHFSPEDGCMILKMRFFALFRYVYKQYLKLIFTEKTGKKYNKDLKAVKYYLNKHFCKGLLTEKSADLLINAANNSLSLKEPLHYLYEDSKTNIPVINDQCLNEQTISDEITVDPGLFEAIIQSDSSGSVKDHKIYSSLEMLSESAPALEKYDSLNDKDLDLDLLSFEFSLWEKDLIKVEAPKKLKFEKLYKRVKGRNCLMGACYRYCPKDIEETSKIALALNLIYERKNRKSGEKTEEIIVEEKKNIFNFQQHGYSAECLKLYGIDPSYFFSLSLPNQLQELQNRKNNFENKLEEYDFVGNGYPSNALELYKIEKSTFYALPNELKEEVLQDAKRKCSEESEQEISLDLKAKLLKKLLYKGLREKMEIRRITAEDAQEPYDPEDIKQIALHIKELDKDERDQLYILMTREFRNFLPEEIRNAIIAANPKEEAGLFDVSSKEDELESNFSDDQKYMQDESFKSNFQEISEKKARNLLFTSFPFNKDVKSQLDKEDFFLELPVLSDKALFNALRIFCNNFDPEGARDDLWHFLLDIQFNPVNATRILDYCLFALCDCVKKSYEGYADQPKEHPLNYSFIPSKYSLYTKEETLHKPSKISTRFCKFLANLSDNGCALPLILNCLYNEQKGLSFAGNDLIPRLPQLDEFRSSASEPCRFLVLEIAFKIWQEVEKPSNESLSSRKLIENILCKLISVPEGSNKRPIYPLMRLESPKFLKSLLSSIVFSMAKDAILMKEKNNSEQWKGITDIVKQILIVDNDLVSDLFEISIEAYLGKLNEEVEHTLEEINEFGKSFYFNSEASREGKAAQLLNDVLAKNTLNKRARIFRLMVRDIVTVFNSFFKAYSVKKFKTEYNEWAEKNPDASEDELKIFRQKLKILISGEKLQRIAILKKIICTHEKLNCFLKSSVEMILLLQTLLGGFLDDLEDMETDNINALILYFSYGIKTLIQLHDFINTSDEDNSRTQVLSTLVTKEVIEPEPKINVAKLARAYTQINSENIGLSDLYDILLEKSYPFILNLIKQSASSLIRYESIFKNFSKAVKINFEKKTHFLVSFIKKRAQSAGFDPDSEPLELAFDRRELVCDSVQKFMSMHPYEFALKKFHVTFKNEIGIDAGGLSREFLTILVEDIINPNFGLFEYTSKNTIQPSPTSRWIPDHLTYFKFLGRLIGKCLADKKPLNIHFVKSFLKHILGRTLYIKDLEDIDPVLYRNLEWILENPIEGVLDLTFSTEVVEFGHVRTIDFVPDGRNIEVTEANKKEYLKRFCYYKMADSISQQITALVEGLRDIVPMAILKLLDEKELSLLISGMPDIDVEDMMTNAEFNLGNSSYLHDWIGEVLSSFSQKELADFLFFVTGSTNVPVGGFKNFRLKFSEGFSNPESLPISHTCYLQIDLPPYQTKEILKEKLLMAINEGTGGFYIS